MTSSRVERNWVDAGSRGSPSVITPWATASRLTSEVQITSPPTLATTLSPGSGLPPVPTRALQALSVRSTDARRRHPGTRRFMKGDLLRNLGEESNKSVAHRPCKLKASR